VCVAPSAVTKVPRRRLAGRALIDVAYGDCGTDLHICDGPTAGDPAGDRARVRRLLAEPVDDLKAGTR